MRRPRCAASQREIESNRGVGSIKGRLSWASNSKSDRDDDDDATLMPPHGMKVSSMTTSSDQRRAVAEDFRYTHEALERNKSTMGTVKDGEHDEMSEPHPSKESNGALMKDAHGDCDNEQFTRQDSFETPATDAQDFYFNGSASKCMPAN